MRLLQTVFLFVLFSIPIPSFTTSSFIHYHINQDDSPISYQEYKLPIEEQNNLSETIYLMENLPLQGPPPRRTVAIIVQSILYPSVAIAVSQYQNDLQNSGYSTILYTQTIETHQELKGNLTYWFIHNGLIGAVLIGRLPYAQFYHELQDSDAETFICDLYLMDINGIWEDALSNDGIFDRHNSSLHRDIYPEIFVGRIDPSCLTWGGNCSDHINRYLSRVHDYRTGNIIRQKRALVYVDDDWSNPWGTIWDNDIGSSYSIRTLVNDNIITNASDWLDRLKQDYQWGHVCVHSNPTMHGFGLDGSGEGIVDSLQIRNVPPSFNFYNLFSCSGAKWTVNNNLAVTYTFSSDYSLATIGSSKTGGMMDCEFFYDPLGQNATLGESLVHWFTGALNSNSTAGSDYLMWYYGMNIVGDPLLTINYDCTVLQPELFSPTHPDADRWYSNTQPHFNWTAPNDVNAITGYYYILDQNPSTVPTRTTGIYIDTTSVQIDAGLNDGAWYLHVVAEDSVGNIGQDAAHYKIYIDTTPPETSINSPVPFYNSSVSSIDLSWSADDSFSGYSYSTVWIDNPSNIVCNESIFGDTIEDLTEGLHDINITVYDAAGNAASNQIRICIDLTDPYLNIESPFEGSIIGSTITFLWNVIDNESGYQYAEVQIDDNFQGIIVGPVSEITLIHLEEGSRLANVTVFDWAGRSSSNTLTIHVFLILDLPWHAFFIGFSITCAIAYLIYRFQRKSG